MEVEDQGNQAIENAQEEIKEELADLEELFGINPSGENLAGRGWFQWIPTSPLESFHAESRMFDIVKVPLKRLMVPAGDDFINTIVTKPTKKNLPPLVLIHGFGAGVGFWSKNYDALSEHFQVYAIDLRGFGRSSRPAFTLTDPVEAEGWWIESIEQWRKSMKLEKFYLLGHSLGGFLVGCYTLKYPERVHHLILADPVGIPVKPQETTPAPPPNWRARLATSLWSFGLFSVLRGLGPLGPRAVRRMRPDMTKRFPYEDDTVSNYIYHIGASEASGERAFSTLFIPFTWAHNPLSKRFAEYRNALPKMSFIYGAQSWVSSSPGKALRDELGADKVSVSFVPAAGHHLYADNIEDFHDQVIATKRRSPWVQSESTGLSNAQMNNFEDPLAAEDEMLHPKPEKKLTPEQEAEAKRMADMVEKLRGYGLQ